MIKTSLDMNTEENQSQSITIFYMVSSLFLRMGSKQPCEWHLFSQLVDDGHNSDNLG